jgi:hypothetical protein
MDISAAVAASVAGMCEFSARPHGDIAALATLIGPQPVPRDFAAAGSGYIKT